MELLAEAGRHARGVQVVSRQSPQFILGLDPHALGGDALGRGTRALAGGGGLHFRPLERSADEQPLRVVQRPHPRAP